MNILFRNDDDIECESDGLTEPAEDFCSESSVDSYLRVYTVIVGDFELNDYRQAGSVTFLWLCITFLGAIILLNTLIAGKQHLWRSNDSRRTISQPPVRSVITFSYTQSHQSSIILFRK